MKAPANPSAFPSQLHDPRDPGEYDPEFGMSLRDWFAGQALPAFAAYGPAGHAPARIIAEAAYELADAMLAARDGDSTATPPDRQHVAYYDDGAFHWMSGIKPRNCELYADRSQS